MYNNLEAELRRKKIRRIDLADRLGLALSTVSGKLNGKSEISINLAKEIKKFLGVDTEIEILFEEANKSAQERDDLICKRV